MNEVQYRELNILKEVVKVIDNHNLRYFAVGGTCIGAIRHNGFIPWDEDIDIAMPREDYELFRTKYYKELPAYLSKLDYDENEKYPFMFIKIHDIQTTYIRKYAKGISELYSGAFIDIMPMDGLPKEELKKRFVLRRLKLYRSLNSWARPLNDNFKRTTISRVANRVLPLFFRWNYFTDRVYGEFRKFNFDDSVDIVFTWRNPKIDYCRRVYRKDIFSKFINISFEDTSVRVPERYDEYLKIDFGDYMRLPPKDEQHDHHDYIICDMEKPYLSYAEEKIE